MKRTSVLLLLASLGGVLASQASAPASVLAPIAYPEGYRGWTEDSRRFASTGGWGFQRFVKDSKTELAATPTPQTCFTCHDQIKKDGLVLSTFRP